MEFVTFLVQFTNSQLKLIETTFDILAGLEIFPEFWYGLMNQHVVYVVKYRFINIIQYSQAVEFVSNQFDFLVCTASVFQLQIDYNNKKIL